MINKINLEFIFSFRLIYTDKLEKQHNYKNEILKIHYILEIIEFYDKRL